MMTIIRNGCLGIQTQVLQPETGVAVRLLPFFIALKVAFPQKINNQSEARQNTLRSVVRERHE